MEQMKIKRWPRRSKKIRDLGLPELRLLVLFLATVSTICKLPLSFALGSDDALQMQSMPAIDSIIGEAINQGTIPGAVVLIGHNGRVVYRKAFGMRSLESVKEPMTVDTIFDLASLTKCIATTTSVMKLFQDGRVRLNDPVSVYLPGFSQNGKADITVRQLLTHYSGFGPDLDLHEQWHGREAALQMVLQQRPMYPPGSRFLYSDINFETLGFLVEQVTGTSLDVFAKQNIFNPLDMKDTQFRPTQQMSSRVAPTQYDENHSMLRGTVHDPTARRMDGVAGHAGLFSTVDDLAIFAQEMLSGSKVLTRSTIERMTTPQQPIVATTLRGLGWDIDSPLSSNRGELLPVGSYGHTGFTGTSLWIDPVTNTYVIILTNAVHPNGGKSTVSLRARIATAVVQSLALSTDQKERLRLTNLTGYNEVMSASRREVARNGDVKTGIDVLESHSFRDLLASANQPLRIGLVANQTAVDAAGRSTADVLAHTPGIQLNAIFSPEHGMAGKLDSADIKDSQDPKLSVPVYSVYGDTEKSRRPTAAALATIDVLVYDIQDIGVRFYTYESTLGYFLEAASKAGKRIIVLDRPNPLTGALVQGPVADPEREAFTSYWRTPVRHGMTVGELATMFNVERSIGAQLEVIAMEGWMRGDWFDSTGRLWIDPSPNMRSLNEAALYPGVGMIEYTNISVGRGTDTPFEVVGAPWVDRSHSGELAAYLNGRGIPGVRFIPVQFTPESSSYAHQKCNGVNLMITDRDNLDSVELGAEIASALQLLYPRDYELGKLDKLMVNKDASEAIISGQDPRRVSEQWQTAVNQFQSIRAKYLLY